MTTTSAPAVRTASGTTHDSTVGSGWTKAAAAGGFAFVVLDVVASFLPGTPPASDASAAKVAVYFRDHASGIKGQLLVGGLGIAALMWWFGTLWRVLSKAEGERPRLAPVAAVALVVGVTLALLSSAINSAVALRPSDIATTHLFFSFSFIVSAAAGFGIAVFLFAACSVTYRTGLTPRWVSYVGLLAGVVFLAGTLGTITDAAIVNLLGLFAFLIWCVWIIAVSVCMLRWSDS
jgi:hypothetical protein